MKPAGVSISKQWLRENIRHLPLLLIIASSICGMLVIGFFVIDLLPSGKTPNYSMLGMQLLLIFINLMVIPLGVINFIYLFKKLFYNNKPWSFMLLKFIALVLGVTFSTVICEGVELVFELMGWLHSHNNTNITVQGHHLSELEAALLFNNMIGLSISVPIFIKQSRDQDIELKLKEKELELSQAEKINTQARLEALQSKINPHFLYNSLNSIASLAHEDPNKVEKMAISLSKLFRYSISSSNKHTAIIREEIEIVKTYMDIEKIRFGEKINFELDLRANENIEVPRFLIQPLVENSIKHGTSKITSSGQIKLEIIDDAKTLCINVYDNGPDFPESLLGGYGIQSIQDKLELLYMKNFEIAYTNGKNKHISIVIYKEDETA